MQTVTLQVADGSMDKLMAFLNEMPADDVQVVKSTISTLPTVPDISSTPTTQKKSMTVDELYGILAPYAKGRLTDKDIEDAIAESITSQTKTSPIDHDDSDSIFGFTKGDVRILGDIVEPVTCDVANPMSLQEKRRIDERLDDIEKNGFTGRDYRDVLADMRTKLAK